MAKMEFVEFPHNHGIGAIDRVLTEVVDELQAQAEHLATPLRKTFTGHPLPSRTEVVQMVELVRSVIFPGYVGSRDVTEESLGYHMRQPRCDRGEPRLPHGRGPPPGGDHHDRRDPPRAMLCLRTGEGRPRTGAMPRPGKADHRAIPAAVAGAASAAGVRCRGILRG